MKKKCQATASDVPTNIVYKHKKTVYWITDNSTNTEKTSIQVLGPIVKLIRVLHQMQGKKMHCKKSGKL